MISIKKNFIFVHIPKTAGNSLQNILRDYSEDKIVCKASHQDGLERFEIESEVYGTTKHSTLADYKRQMEKNHFERAFKFTCVRNPWDRMISFYFSPHRGVTQWDRNAFIKFIHTVPSTLSYLSLPDVEMENTLDSFNYVIKFEHLEQGFKEVCQYIGIPFKELPVRNKAPKSHYSDYYDNELIEMVGSLFKDEVVFFNYSYENFM